ncbi:ribosome maturation factor RimP [Zhaonella formicivorans]|uniref:ribosome maturation factor RimP n=1 Tax=Zhaonella formicivorans TaxID=2528593 RepID=UPI0010E466AC|nr:ribosome maturation factor RimP [Zhaonella formicivorans]
MAKYNVEERVEQLVKPAIEEAGYELVSIQYVKEGPDWYLRFFIDHQEGIGLDDCELISRKVEAILDKADPIPDSYVLEVSSPGIERPLKNDEDFAKYQGELVIITTFAPVEGKKQFKGILKGSTAEEVSLLVGKKEMHIPRKLISKAHLTVDF